MIFKPKHWFLVVVVGAALSHVTAYIFNGQAAVNFLYYLFGAVGTHFAIILRKRAGRCS